MTPAGRPTSAAQVWCCLVRWVGGWGGGTWSLGLIGNQAAHKVGVGAPQVGHQLPQIFLQDTRTELKL